MAIDAKKHTTFAAGETPKRQIAGGAGLADSILSVNDIVPVASATDQAQTVAGLSSTPYQVGPSRPLTTYRQDAPGLHRIETTIDPTGAVFAPVSGVLHFLNDAARNTWTSANSSYLTAGDICVSNGYVGYWTGAAWIQDTDYSNSPAALGAFSQYTAGGFNGLLVARRSRVVHLNGPVTATAAFTAGSTTIATLAAGYRPPYSVAVSALYGSTAGTVTVLASGVIQPNVSGASGTAITLAGAFLI